MFSIVLLFILIEQSIKVIIYYCFLHKSAPILPPVLYFEPMFNRDYSWINSMMQLGVGKWAHITLGTLMILFIYMFYRFLNHRMLTSKIINIMFAFVLAGAVCSLIDKVFWDGSLDYIMLNGFFTFDLKDLYINFSIGILTVLIITKNKVLEKFDDKDMVKDFAKYIIQIARKS